MCTIAYKKSINNNKKKIERSWLDNKYCKATIEIYVILYEYHRRPIWKKQFRKLTDPNALKVNITSK